MDDPSSTQLVAALILGTGVATLFAAATAGLNQLGVAHLEALSEGDGRDGKTAAAVLERLDRVATRLLVGRVAFVSIASASAVVHFIDRGVWPALLAGFGTAMVYALFAEIAGGVIRRRASRATLPLVRFLRPLELLVAPLAWPIDLLGRSTSKATPVAAHAPDVASRAVEHLIERGEEAGQIGESQAQLLYSVLEFRDTIAREIMVPRTQVEAFSRTTSLDKVLEVIEGSAHSRYPVYTDSIDHVDGILYAKDVFRLLRTQEDPDGSIESIIRPMFFTPEHKKIGVLLREMQAQRFHLAIVVDEFGGVSGIVTLEDIVEEIVGEIEDEHDDAAPRIEELTTDCWSIDAAVSVHDVEEQVDSELIEGGNDYDSIGGLVMHLVGEVPDIGHVLTVGEFEITVLAADERKVSRVELRRVLAESPHP